MKPDHSPFTPQQLADTPIAIVGLAGLFPKARNLRDYWSNIVEGADCIEDVPESHWRLEDHYDPDPTAEDKTYCKRGGFLPDIRFNPMEFGIPPTTLDVTDILQLLSLVVARDVLADAGCDRPEKYDPSRTGVILGITGANSLTQPLSARLQTPVIKAVAKSCGLSERDAETLAQKYKKAFAPWEENSFPGMLGNVVAGRIANRFNFGGTNCTVDAACASSLAAVKMSISELLEGRADLMLTGGCDAENTIFMYLCFSKTPAFSKSGIVRPFDDGADGTLIGEGIGMLALKRLADAERDGDRIYSVIRGIGSSSDGRFKSIYAPRGAGQKLALERAYENARLMPQDIGLVEAHGTGTAVGDLTEITALDGFYRETVSETAFAAIGSVKSQIGHTKAASGAAGLMKLALSLHHRTLPPTINVDKPTQNIDFTISPFYVNVLARPWFASAARPVRRAAISAFGFGGTNFHFLLEQAPGDKDAASTSHRAARAFVWAAPAANDLVHILEGARGHFASHHEPDTIAPHHVRAGFVARTEAEYTRKLEAAIALVGGAGREQRRSHPDGILYLAGAVEGKVAALFAGQGSQYVNMGRSAVLAYPAMRRTIERADSVMPEPVSSRIFPIPVFDAAATAALDLRLADTRYAQPAIGALSAGQYGVALALGFHADYFAGHSFGELTALWAAGAYDEHTLLTLAAARGAAMASAPEGAADRGKMAALAVTAAEAKALIEGWPEIRMCNFNAPRQVVVGGPSADIDGLLARCHDSKVEAQALNVSAAFHTPLVAHALAHWSEALSLVDMRAPKHPVISNTTATAYPANSEDCRKLLANQLAEPVFFVDSIETLYAQGVRLFVEFGPRGGLARLVAQILAGREHTVVSMDAGPSKDADTALMQGLLEIKLAGLALSALNSHVGAEPLAPKATPADVFLRGVNVVSANRQAAWDAALNDGYRIESAPAPVMTAAVPHPPVAIPATPAVLPVAPAPAAIYKPAPTIAMPTNKPAASHEPVTDGSFALHEHFLISQLTTAARLTDLLEQGVDAERSHGIDSVCQFGLALGETHLRATELIAGFEGKTSPDLALPATRSYPLNPVPLAAAIPSAPAAAVQPLLPAPATPVTAAPAKPSPVVQAAPRDVMGAIKDIISQATGYPPETIEPQMDLEADLGIDSIKRVEIMARIKDTFGALGEAPQPESVRTLAALTRFIESASGSAAAVPVASQPAVSSADVHRILMETLAEKTGYPVDTLQPEMDLESDLGVDSIKRVEIFSAVRDKLPGLAPLEAEQMAKLRTLRQIADHLAGAGTAAAAAAGTQPARPSMQTLTQSLIEVTATATGYPMETLRPEMDLEADLGVDSIKRVEILSALRERHPEIGHLSPEQLAGRRTLADFAAAMAGDAAPVPAAAAAVATAGAIPGVDPHARIGRFAVAIKSLAVVEPMLDPLPPGAQIAIVEDGSALGQALTDDILAHGWVPVRIQLPAGCDEKIADAALATHAPLDGCIFLATQAEAGHERLAAGLLAARAFLRLRQGAEGRAFFVAVTRLDGRLGFSGNAEAAALGGLSGLVKTLAVEAPAVAARLVDLDPALTEYDAARLVMCEAFDVDAGLREVGVSDEERVTLVPLAPADAHDAADGTLAIGPGDVVIASGGGRGVTASCLLELARSVACEFVLLGRSDLDGRPDWDGVTGEQAIVKAAIAAGLERSGVKPAPKRIQKEFREHVARHEIRATLQALKDLGATVHYLQVDIVDPAALAAALAPWKQRATVLVHGAGVLADRKITEKTRSDIDPVLATKLDGLTNLMHALDPRHLKHAVLFSSAAGFFGNPGQADYAVANEALNRRAWYYAAQYSQMSITSINWGAWDGGMVDANLRKMFAARGVALIPVETGVQQFVQCFRQPHSEYVVQVVGPDTPLTGQVLPQAEALARIARPLALLTAHAIVDAHRIGGRAVLPMTAALSACVHLAEARHPGMLVYNVAEITVLKGVLPEEEPAPLEFELQAHADEREIVADVQVRDGAAPGRPRYRVSGIRLVHAAPPALPDTALAAQLQHAEWTDAAHLYQDGTLFHGPALAGIVRLATGSAGECLAECRLPVLAATPAGWESRLANPAGLDQLLQLALVFARQRTGQASLPLAVSELAFQRQLPVDAAFFLRAVALEEGAERQAFRIEAFDAEGQPYLQFGRVSVIVSAALGEKFRSPTQESEESPV